MAIGHPHDDWDDGGTPGWRARHQPQIVIHHPRRHTFREMLRQQPMLGLWLGVGAAVALYAFFALEAVGFLIYALIYRLLWG
jgi:hypothetical protein